MARDMSSCAAGKLDASVTYQPHSARSNGGY